MIKGTFDKKLRDTPTLASRGVKSVNHPPPTFGDTITPMTSVYVYLMIYYVTVISVPTQQNNNYVTLKLMHSVDQMMNVDVFFFVLLCLANEMCCNNVVIMLINMSCYFMQFQSQNHNVIFTLTFSFSSMIVI